VTPRIKQFLRQSVARFARFRWRAAAPDGAPFHIIAEKPCPPHKRLALAQVDLVNGAVVWYTTEREIAATG